MLRLKRTYLPATNLLRAFSSQKAYLIKESATRGKIAVATRDVKQGELVLEDKEPILFFREQTTPVSAISTVAAAFSAFMKEVSPDKQRKLLTIFGPTTGTSAENIRKFATDDFKYRFKKGEDFRSLTPDEVETFVKVAQVTRLNMFGGDAEGNAVFEDLSHFAHSCDANCNYLLGEKSIACYATRFIKADEELSVSYVSTRDIEPTHERRHKYLEVKEFTCHCPRCNAPGDDTRQFDCFDPACNGAMLARQPINKKPVRVTNLPYNNVEYVEPHLLPCTVCHRAAPADYQAKMFQVEAQLPVIADEMTQRFELLLSQHQLGEFAPLLLDLLSIQIPRRHAASLPLLKLKWRTKHALFLLGQCQISSVQAAISDYLAALEHLFPHPHNELLIALTSITAFCCEARLPPVFSPEEEKELCQKTLRMHLLLNGRDRRQFLVDEATARALEKLPPSESTEVCAFCAESLSDAPFDSRLCYRCGQVAYCSAGCQKAHWKLHKKTCTYC